MKKNRILNRIIFPLIFFFSIPLSAQAQLGDWSKFRFDFGVQEDYTDNVDLRATNTREDWITKVFAGIGYSTLRPVDRTPGQLELAPRERDPWGIDLNYVAGYNYYANKTYEEYWSHDGRLDTWYTFDRRLTLRLKDYLINSTEQQEPQYAEGAPPGSYIPGTEAGKRVEYLRNVLEPSIEYRFGREDLLSLYYRNNYYDSKDDVAYQDSQENYLSPRIDYWFDVRNGITFEYGYTDAKFDRSPDYKGHMGRGRYTYRFDSRTSAFADYLYLYRDLENPGTDYDVQNPSIGIAHAFTPATSGDIQIGYFWYNPKGDETQTGPSINANLNSRTQFTTYTLSLRGGFREEYFSSTNLGPSKYYGGYLSANHQLAQRFTIGARGFVENNKYTDERKDWVWQAGANASYQPLRWLQIWFEYFYRERDSNRDIEDYEENRFILRVNFTI
ncbi:MAG: hypothetical protein H6Q42_1183 [Deltaproteobacteria bacterium]|nr:hypothetical protein [Deltaproteobacteria bacterium]